MDRQQFLEGFKEIMIAYIENRQKWIDRFGTDLGFDTWFTEQIRRCDPKYRGV